MAKITVKFYVNDAGEIESPYFSGKNLEIYYLETVENVIKKHKLLLPPEQWYKARLVKAFNGTENPFWDLYHYELVSVKCCTRFL